MSLYQDWQISDVHDLARSAADYAEANVKSARKAARADQHMVAFSDITAAIASLERMRGFLVTIKDMQESNEREALILAGKMCRCGHSTDPRIHDGMGCTECGCTQIPDVVQ